MFVSQIHTNFVQIIKNAQISFIFVIGKFIINKLETADQQKSLLGSSTSGGNAICSRSISLYNHYMHEKQKLAISK
jgi:hypothetical protein